MKSIKRSVLCALLFSMAACGGDSERGVDPMSFMPKLPAIEQPATNVAQSEPAVTPAKPAVEPSIIVHTKFDDALAQGKALAAKGDTAIAMLMIEDAAKRDKMLAEPDFVLAKIFFTIGVRGLAMAAANKAV